METIRAMPCQAQLVRYWLPRIKQRKLNSIPACDPKVINSVTPGQLWRNKDVRYSLAVEGQKMAGATGGIQCSQGTLFGFPYSPGSWQDKAVRLKDSLLQISYSLMSAPGPTAVVESKRAEHEPVKSQTLTWLSVGGSHL